MQNEWSDEARAASAAARRASAKAKIAGTTEAHVKAFGAHQKASAKATSSGDEEMGRYHLAMRDRHVKEIEAIRGRPVSRPTQNKDRGRSVMARSIIDPRQFRVANLPVQNANDEDFESEDDGLEIAEEATGTDLDGDREEGEDDEHRRRVPTGPIQNSCHCGGTCGKCMSANEDDDSNDEDYGSYPDDDVENALPPPPSAGTAFMGGRGSAGTPVPKTSLSSGISGSAAATGMTPAGTALGGTTETSAYNEEEDEEGEEVENGPATGPPRPEQMGPSSSQPAEGSTTYSSTHNPYRSDVQMTPKAPESATRSGNPRATDNEDSDEDDEEGYDLADNDLLSTTAGVIGSLATSGGAAIAQHFAPSTPTPAPTTPSQNANPEGINQYTGGGGHAEHAAAAHEASKAAGTASEKATSQRGALAHASTAISRAERAVSGRGATKENHLRAGEAHEKAADYHKEKATELSPESDHAKAAAAHTQAAERHYSASSMAQNAQATRNAERRAVRAFLANEANFVSEAQRKYLWSQEPDIAEAWSHGEHTSDKDHRMPAGPGKDVAGPMAKAARDRKKKQTENSNPEGRNQYSGSAGKATKKAEAASQYASSPAASTGDHAYAATAHMNAAEKHEKAGNEHQAAVHKSQFDFHQKMSQHLTKNAFERDSGGRFGGEEEQQAAAAGDGGKGATEAAQVRAVGQEKRGKQLRQTSVASDSAEGMARVAKQQSANAESPRSVWNKLFDLLTGNSPARRHQSSGKFLAPNAGDGKGPVHEHATESAARRNDHLEEVAAAASQNDFADANEKNDETIDGRDSNPSHRITGVPRGEGMDDTSPKSSVKNGRTSVAKPNTLREITGNSEEECPECGGAMSDGECEECGYEEDVEVENGPDTSGPSVPGVEPAHGVQLGMRDPSSRGRSQFTPKAPESATADGSPREKPAENRRVNNAFPPQFQHQASREAAGASVMSEHPEAREHGLAAMDFSGKGDSAGARASHMKAARRHDQAAVSAREEDDEDGASSHDQAAMLHRKAASIHRANPMEQPQNQEIQNRSSAARSAAGTHNQRRDDMDRKVTINGVTKRESEWANDAVVANAARAGFKVGGVDWVYNAQGKLVKNDGGPSSADAAGGRGRGKTIQAGGEEELEGDEGNMWASKTVPGLAKAPKFTREQTEAMNQMVAQNRQVRNSLIGQIVANVGDKAKRDRMVANLNELSTDDLRIHAEAVSPQGGSPNLAVFNEEVTDFNFAGASGGDAGAVTNAEGDDGVLDLPTMNHAELAAENAQERASREAMKARVG